MISLGYVFTRPVARDAWLELATPAFVTLTPCLARFVPDDWAIRWWGVDDRIAEARAAGVPDAAIERAIDWVTERLDPGPIGVTSTVSTLDVAHELGRVAQLGDDAWLAGMAIDDADVQRFLDETAPSGPTEGEFGERYVARMAHAPTGGGDSLGWDIVCFDQARGHSYLCNNLAPQIANALGHAPNAYGLYDDEAAARAIAAWVARDEVGAEPGTWLAVQITRYPWAGSAEQR